MWIPRIRFHAVSPRAAFIARVGIGCVGVPLGCIVFAWLLATNYATSFEHLRTAHGWLRLLLLAAVCFVEWVIAAGWIAGSLLWLWRTQPVRDRRGRRR